MAHDEGHGKVLIVDDEPSIRSSLKMMLKDEGYTPTVASDGSEAIKKLESEEFDVVLLDLVMEPVGGIEVLKALHERWHMCAVVVMTGFATIESAVSTLKLGAYDYLLKPFKPDELFNTVRKAVEWRRLELELAVRGRQLKESRRRYQTLFEETSDAVVVFDRIGTIRDANTFATRLFGYSRDELLEMSFFDLYAEKDRYTVEQVFPSVVGGYSAYFEIEFKRKSGSSIVGEMSARSMELDGERVFQVVIRDITNRKRLVEECLVAKEGAEHLMGLLCAHLLGMVENATTALSASKPEVSDALSSLAVQRSTIQQAHTLSELSEGVPTGLDESIKAAVGTLSQAHPAVSVSYEPTGLRVLAGEQLESVILWVLDDAATRGAGEVQIATEQVGESAAVRLCISDDAPCRQSIGLHMASMAAMRWEGEMSMQEMYEGAPDGGCSVCMLLKLAHS